MVYMKIKQFVQKIKKGGRNHKKSSIEYRESLIKILSSFYVQKMP